MRREKKLARALRIGLRLTPSARAYYIAGIRTLDGLDAELVQEVAAGISIFSLPTKALRLEEWFAALQDGDFARADEVARQLVSDKKSLRAVFAAIAARNQLAERLGRNRP